MERKGYSMLASFLAPSLTAAVLVLPSLSCSKPIKVSLKDTEGRSFSATCSEGSCELQTGETAEPSAPKPDGASSAFILHRASRLYAVCEVWKQGSSHAVNAADCRALSCDRDQDCPPVKGLTEGACTNHLCIEPTGSISAEDAVLLCLAGTGKPAGTTKQVERYALGNACAEPCSVPAVCRQP